MNNLEALVKGKQLIDSAGTVLHLKGVILASEYAEMCNGSNYDLTQLEELEVYINPLQVEIDRLNGIIKELLEEKDKKKKSNDESRYKFRRTYNHLSKEEVREIKIIFETKPNTSRSLIISTYDSSQAVISHIASGTHAKTSEQYKTFLLKRQLHGTTTDQNETNDKTSVN